MSSIVRKLAVVAVMLIFVQTTFAQRRERDKILDRKVFVVTMELQVEKERNKEDPFEDELSFRTNKMTSKEMRMSNMGGFQMGEYVVNKKEEVVGEEVFHFEAINKNAKDMSLKWEGKVFGNQIEGTAIVSKKGKIKEEYAFKGALKEKK